MKFEAHPKTLGSLTTCLDLAEAVRASMYPSAASRLTPWLQYELAPRLELLRLRSLVGGNRATSRLKRLPSTAASRDRTPARAGGPTAAATGAPTRCSPWTGRKFDCTTRAGVLDALAQTKPEPAPTGRIIPPPRQSYKQRPLSVAAMRHIEWLMAPQTPRELVWRILEYWNVRT